jgi:hypothetical protein
MLTEGKCIPLSVCVDGANCHDKKLVKRTLGAIFFKRPSSDDVIQNIGMDKGYNFPDIRKLLKGMVILCIKSRGEENIIIEIPGIRLENGL